MFIARLSLCVLRQHLNIIFYDVPERTKLMKYHCLVIGTMVILKDRLWDALSDRKKIEIILDRIKIEQKKIILEMNENLISSQSSEISCI